MAVTTNGTVLNGVHGIQKASTADSVEKVHKQTRQAHIRNLSRLASLSTQVIGESSATTTPTEQIDSTVDEILAHGATTTFFGEILALIQKKELTREELDQKLLNWIFKIPGFKAKFDKLPENVQKLVEEFAESDLHSLPTVYGFRKPTPIAARKCAGLKAAWEEQFKIDGGTGYPGVVEGDGEAVKYVDKAVFQNWGETVQSTPAVYLHLMELTCRSHSFRKVWLECRISSNMRSTWARKFVYLDTG
jgi:hypothetical protein